MPRRKRSGPPVLGPDGRPLRGLAALSPERRREIARKGGKSAHAMGLAHVFTSEDAPIYGLKGVTKRWHGAKKAKAVVTKGE